MQKSISILVLLTLLSGCAIPLVPINAPEDTYFTYTKDELATLTRPRGESATPEQLYGWDELALRFVGEEDAGPTTVAQLLASLAVAQRDAALLSVAAGGTLQRSSVDVLAAETICHFLPTSCPELNRRVTDGADPVATLVLLRVFERYEQNVGRPVPLRPEDAAWKGLNPVTPDAGNWDLWVPVEADVPAPPAVGTPEDAAELEAVVAAVRDVSLDQRKSLLKWSGWRGSETPSGLWLRLADNELRLNRANLADATDIRMRLTIAMADAFTLCWKTKFTYWTARPSQRDATIKPLIPVPNFPSYPSGHATVSGAAAVVLEALLDGEYASVAKDAAAGRVWAGIHFPVDSVEGLELGSAVGAAALAWR